MGKKILLASTALISLAACGGSNEISRVITGADAFNVGSQSNAATASGMQFAADAIVDGFEGYDGKTLTVRLARFETNYETGVSEIIVTEETITVPADGDILESGKFTFRGETITVIQEDKSALGILENGQEIYGGVETSGEFLAILGVYTYANDQIDAFDSEGYTVVGYETRPEDLVAIGERESGTVEYRGFVSGYGNLLDANGDVDRQEVYVDGGIILDVDFGNGELDGELFLALELDDDEGEPTVSEPAAILAPEEPVGYIGMDIDRADIEGNGFSTTTSNIDGCGLGCETNTELGGAFYGLSGEEIGGVVGIDITGNLTNPEDMQRFVGAAGFIAISDFPEFPE